MYLKIDAFRQNTKKKRKEKNEKSSRTISLVEPYLPLSAMNYMEEFLIGQ